MSTISVKHFSNYFPDAPVLSGTVGALIAILDACLVNGYGLKAVDSLTVSGGTGTVTILGGHSLKENMVMSISGALPEILNGDHRVTSVSSTTVTFRAPTIADVTATGMIGAKVASLGWSKVFSATNIAVYKSNSILSTGMYLHVDDSAALAAKVTGYETMTDAVTGNGKFPTDAQFDVGNNAYWVKSSQSSAARGEWTLFGDDRCFYFTQCYYNDRVHTVYTFGDIAPSRAGDVYGCTISFDPLPAGPGYGTPSTGCLGITKFHYDSTTFTARSANGLGGAVQTFRTGGFSNSGSSTYSGGPSYMTITRPSALGLVYPSNTDNSLITIPLFCITDLSIRGKHPGIFHSPQRLANAFQTGDCVEGSGEMEGRTLMAVRPGIPYYPHASSESYGGTVFFDITGPWR